MLVLNRPRLFDISHPSVSYAQHLANLNKRAYVLVPNIIGGIDIVDCARTEIDEDAEVIAAATPTQKAIDQSFCDEVSEPRAANPYRLRFKLWQKRMNTTESFLTSAHA
jgi:hypothetical protein